MFGKPVLRICLLSNLFVPGPQTARQDHLKDGLTRASAEKDDLAAMLIRDAMSERQSQACTFLLALADKRFKKDYLE